jgi:AcrR family transcriptional regulator
MSREVEIKEKLISNAIQLISEGGFEKATTKALAHCGGPLPDLKMNEVYIYRLFGSKEELYEAAFMSLDSELFLALKNGAESLGGFQSNTKEKLYEFFIKAWTFILKDEARCRCYIRYYYSIYFKGKSCDNHRQNFGIMIDAFAPLFKEEANAYAILHSVFTLLLDFAVRVYNGELENNEENRMHIFNVLYCMMMTYFNDHTSIVADVYNKAEKTIDNEFLKDQALLLR